jgi:hypothetical protein
MVAGAPLDREAALCFLSIRVPFLDHWTEQFFQNFDFLQRVTMVNENNNNILN